MFIFSKIDSLPSTFSLSSQFMPTWQLLPLFQIFTFHTYYLQDYPILNLYKSLYFSPVPQYNLFSLFHYLFVLHYPSTLFEPFPLLTDFYPLCTSFSTIPLYPHFPFHFSLFTRFHLSMKIMPSL